MFNGLFWMIMVLSFVLAFLVGDMWDDWEKRKAQDGSHRDKGIEKYSSRLYHE